MKTKTAMAASEPAAIVRKSSRPMFRERFRQDKFSALRKPLQAAGQKVITLLTGGKVMTKDELHGTSKEQNNQPKGTGTEKSAVIKTLSLPAFAPQGPRPPAPRPSFAGPPVAMNIKVLPPEPVLVKKDDPAKE